jgi:hypothetical protein
MVVGACGVGQATPAAWSAANWARASFALWRQRACLRRLDSCRHSAEQMERGRPTVRMVAKGRWQIEYSRISGTLPPSC